MTLSDKLEKLLALSKASSPGPWDFADGYCYQINEEFNDALWRCQPLHQDAAAIIYWRRFFEPLVAVAEAAANPDLKLGNEELDGAESIRWYAASKALTHALAALDSLELK